MAPAFGLSEELQALREMIREFVRRELIPLEPQVPEAEDIPLDLRRRLSAKTQEMGLWAPDIPEEEGGAGLGELATVLIAEEMAYSVLLPFRARSLVNDSMLLLLRRCRGEQRARFWEPAMRMEKRFAFALTEPDAGSDAAGIRTRAVQDGDHWVINGRKIFISNGAVADVLQVMAVTDPSRGARGITCFLVERETPGFEVTRQTELMIGERPAELLFSDCRVPAANMLGELGQGFALIQEWLTRNRLRHSAKCIGRAQRALDMATAYARERVTFGKPLAERQAIQWYIADSIMDLHLARLALYQCAARVDAGADTRLEGPMVKITCNEAAWRTIDRCVQIFGGLGLSKELPIERIFRELRTTRITEGPTEIHRMRIARLALQDHLRPTI